jgi:hypothetical protein
MQCWFLNPRRIRIASAALVTAATATAHAATISLLDEASDLKLDETVVYAVNVDEPGSTQPSVTISGVTFVSFTNNPPTGFRLTSQSLGSFDGGLDLSTPPTDNAALEDILESNRDGRGGPGGAVMNLELDVTPGVEYRLQLLFAETFGGNKSIGSRVTDVTAEGSVVLADDLDLWDGYTFTDANGDTQGAALIEEVFIAGDSEYTVVFNPSADNPLLSGVVLTIVPEPGAMSLLAMGALLLVKRRCPQD